ncbi:MAG: molecular chaperone HtpG [Candidatus Omnitrophota bacterium]
MTDAERSEKRESHSFQAEVKQVLDIVIHSLYTNREIFVRELISNAADALEKIRYEKLLNPDAADPDLPLEIRIDVDAKAKTISIADSGIGMTEEELIRNLGTIAHSGTRDFLQRHADATAKDAQLIGQFGVGFYSSFMAAKNVRVYTRSYKPDAEGWLWESDGMGEYVISPAENLKRGTKIVLELREEAEEFASVPAIERIVKQYSNFVPFPIVLDGKTVNTIQAIWTRNKNEVKDEEYAEFFKFVANDHDEPLYRFHFSADVPLQIHSLLFVPKSNFESFGFGRLDPGVNLYCRKVLIQQHSEAILPEWLRFVKGVVDSEDLPLNISRETLQDNALVRKLRKVIATRFLKFLAEEASSNPENYQTFWKTFGVFLKEGAARDYEYREELNPLLRFESSKEAPGRLISLADYAARMKAGQNNIYYVNGPSRDAIQNSPYMEAFRQRDLEALYVFDPIDDFVLNAIHEFDGKKIIPADQADLDLPDAPPKPEEEQKDELTRDEVDSLTGWFKIVLGDRVDSVRESKRLVDSPAIVVNVDAGMTSGMQRIMQSVNKDFAAIGRKNLEINSHHPIMVQLAKRREKGDDEFLKLAAEQIFDNALTAAGLLTDPRPMVNRTYQILEKALRGDE